MSSIGICDYSRAGEESSDSLHVRMTEGSYLASLAVIKQAEGSGTDWKSCIRLCILTSWCIALNPYVWKLSTFKKGRNPDMKWHSNKSLTTFPNFHLNLWGLRVFSGRSDVPWHMFFQLLINLLTYKQQY